MFWKRLWSRLRRKGREESQTEQETSATEQGDEQAETAAEAAGGASTLATKPRPSPQASQQELLRHGLEELHRQIERLVGRLSALETAANALSRTAEVQSRLPQQIAEAIRNSEPSAIQREMNGRLESLRGQSLEQTELLRGIESRAGALREAVDSVGEATRSARRSTEACHAEVGGVRGDLQQFSATLMETIETQQKRTRRRVIWLSILLTALLAALVTLAYLLAR